MTSRATLSKEVREWASVQTLRHTLIRDSLILDTICIQTCFAANAHVQQAIHCDHDVNKRSVLADVRDIIIIRSVCKHTSEGSAGVRSTRMNCNSIQTCQAHGTGSYSMLVILGVKQVCSACRLSDATLLVTERSRSGIDHVTAEV